MYTLGATARDEVHCCTVVLLDVAVCKSYRKLVHPFTRNRSRTLFMRPIAPPPPPPSRCRNFDGGFGCIPGAESHAGQIFTCVGALSIARSLHLVDEGTYVL